MAGSSLSLNLASSTTLSKKLNLPASSSTSKPSAVSLPSTITCSLRDSSNSDEDRNYKRRPLLLGVGALALSLLPVRSLLAEEIPVNYEAFVDVADGYSYYYPSDWVDFDYRGHDSAFKDRYLQLQNVRLSFIPTDKSDIHDMGPRDEVVTNLLRHVYAAPSQKVTVFDVQERTTDGKNYYTFEYALTSRNYSRAAFATIAIGNGRYYTMIVGANERRWKRVRNQLKVVADSFKVVANILSKGTKLREYTKGVENNLRQVELDSIQDYIKESDNLVSLHDQIRDCDIILSQMETLLSGFQSEIGSISSDIKVLQEKSMDMGLKLKNRKVAESKLAKFVEDIIVPPRMIDIIVDGEVNDEYMRTLEILSKKLKFVEVDIMVKTSSALKDVQPELEKLRQKAVSKVFEFIVQKLHALRKPKTNIQILQQSVLLKYKYIISFLKEHGKEIYAEVRAAYIDTMNKVLSAHFRVYIQALEKLQLDIATSSDMIGIDTRSTGLFSRGKEPLKNRSAVFALGERISILKEIDEPALIPHIAEANSRKYPYEVLFRSLHKLLMDTATSEYLFCGEFFGEESTFNEIFSGPFTVIDEHFNLILTNCFDAIGLMLMIRIIHHHQLIMSRRRIPCLDSYLDKVNISLWPRFKMVFDMHLNSLRNANVKTLWEDDVHPHYAMRRYAEFTASLIHLNVEYGDGQLELNLERLRMAVDDLLNKLAKTFTKPKPQTVFLINNYDMTIAVLKEAGPEGGKIQLHFEDLLKNNTSIFVEELLLEHFGNLIKFVKMRAAEDPTSGSDRPITVAEVEPLVKDFASRWKTAIELMHSDVITSFSNFLCGMEILRAALTQLLLYYTRLTDCIKKISGGSALNKELVSISSIMHEIRKYSRTF